MFTVRLKGAFLLFSVIQLVVTTAMFWLVYYLYTQLRFEGNHPAENYVYAWIVLLAAYGIEIASRSDRKYLLPSLSKERLVAICHRQALFPLAFTFGFLVMMKNDSLSRLVLLSFFTLYLGWIFLTNLKGYQLLVHYLYGNEQKGYFPVLLIGSSSAIKRYMQQPEQIAPPGIQIEGMVETDTEAGERDLSNLAKICQKKNIKAILCIDADCKELSPSVSEVSNDLGIRIIWLEDVEERYGRGSVAGNTSSYSVIAPLREPLENPINRLFKRIFDLSCSLVGIIFILPPAMLFVALLHRRYAPGPLFYRQDRSGRHGEVFKVTKFRSMYVSDDDRFVQAQSGDSRIFKGGDLIRKFSIDELPQLIDVFFGKMSIVGPRPHPLKLDETLAQEAQAYRVRNQAKPGITGLAQSRGYRGETIEPNQIKNRVKMDLFYIRNWSMILDIRIIVETAWQIIVPPKSAR